MNQQLTEVIKEIEIIYYEKTMPLREEFRLKIPFSPSLAIATMNTPFTDKVPAAVELNWFSLKEIPRTMEKLNFKVAARLQDKWFANPAYQMHDNEKKGEVFYGAPQLIDRTTIKMSWLLSFPRAKNSILQLIKEEYLFTRASKKVLKKILNYEFLDVTKFAYIEPWQGELCEEFHRLWQFQRIIVDDGFLDKGQRFIEGADDLYASLGTFSCHAAISKAHVTQMAEGKQMLTILEIVVYARDTYDFNDGEKQISSQYLGHWNHEKLHLVPSSIMNGLDNDPYITALPPTRDNTFFCIRDIHYRNWREKNKRGGDMLIFSEPLVFPVNYKVIL